MHTASSLTGAVLRVAWKIDGKSFMFNKVVGLMDPA